jgi:TetR/AcrR family transcriptional regulator, transcriptional repressor for nem operon
MGNMRRKGVVKEETRLKVIDAASRHFRKYGYAGVGVDALAKGAGVTSGAIYAHFGSKAGIFSTALEAGLNEVIEGLPVLQAKHGDGWLDEFIDYYLGSAHRKDTERVCAMASLTCEVIRFDGEVHAQYEAKMQRIATIIAEGLRTSFTDRSTDRMTMAESMTKAWMILSLLTGGLNIARAMGNEATSEQIAKAVKDTAKALAKGSAPAP